MCGDMDIIVKLCSTEGNQANDYNYFAIRTCFSRETNGNNWFCLQDANYLKLLNVSDLLNQSDIQNPFNIGRSRFA